jgi:uncharacterized membrane protein HdeD (DUF308 family)
MTATPAQGPRPATADDEPRAAPGESAVTANRYWLRLLGGIVAILLGGAAFAWPDATVQVIAVLFGLNLIVSGFVRAAFSLFQSTYPVMHRVLGVVFGVLTGLIGILCLRNLTGSLVVLTIVVAVGWLLDGLAQIMLASGGPAEARGGPRFATGLVAVIGAVTILAWPKIGFGVFIFIGATVLVFVGIGAVIMAIAGMRAHRT